MVMMITDYDDDGGGADGAEGSPEEKLIDTAMGRQGKAARCTRGNSKQDGWEGKLRKRATHLVYPS